MNNNVKIRMCESALARIAASPDVLGYFPDSKMKIGDSPDMPSIHAERKSIEALLVSAAYRGELDSINVLSEGVPLAIFERYENFLDEKVVNADIRDILFSGAEFPNGFFPLAGISVAYLSLRIKHADLDEYMVAFKKMGLSEMAKDPRYLAAMLRKVFSLANVAENKDELFGSLMGKFTDHGVFIKPTLIPFDVNLDDLVYPPASSWENTSKKDPDFNYKHSYVSALINHRAMGGNLPFPDSDFSNNSIISNFVRAYTLESSRREGLAEQYLDTYGFRDIFNGLESGLKEIKNGRQYITSTKSSEFNHFSLLCMIMKNGHGRSLKSRKRLIKAMLQEGLSEKLKTSQGLVRFLQQFNGAHVDSDLYQMVFPLVDFSLLDKAIRPVEIVRMALEQNQFAYSHLCAIENSYNKGRFVNVAFLKMTENEQREAVQLELPGFTHDLLRESRHNGIKREFLTRDMGM
jgi:hypothetical protein